MKQIDKKGKSLNEIISSFRREHRIKDWELQYEILSEASGGFLGLFGKKQAAVRFKLLNSEERIKLFLEQLLNHLDIRFDKITTRIDHKTVYATINNSSDAGFIIGKNGSMLEQLQYLVNRVFENVRDLERIYLDTENYRQRQEDAFLRNYIPIINKVKATGKAATLEPMQAGERRIIHKYVEGEKTLKTLTVGDGDHRRIQVLPAAQVKPETPKPRTVKIPPKPGTVKTPPKPRPELTPQERASQSYKKHNLAHPDSRTSKRPRKATKVKPPSQ